MNGVKAIRDKLEEFQRSDTGRRTARVLQLGITAAVIIYLIVRLTEIGWSNILSELPREPLFYLLFLILYVSLPVAELLVYRIVWGPLPRGALFRTLVRKRVLNRDVLGYSGEVYLFSWARRNVQASERELLKSIRDTNIVSSVASTLIAVSLLLVFLYLGHLNLRTWVSDQPLHYLLVAAVGAVIFGVVIWRFRRYLFSMAWRTTLLVFAVYAGRLVIGQVVQIGQWSVVLPEVPLGVWFTFAAASLVISRIPFVPNQDLVFLGASVELSTMMEVPEASIAGMLLVVSVLDKSLNLGLFLGFSFWERRRGIEPPIVPADETLEELAHDDGAHAD